jgi:hypothetical protein
VTCAEAGEEIACITDVSDTSSEPPRIVFIARDGILRCSSALSDPVVCGGGRGCDLVFLGDGLGLVWPLDDGGKGILTYARTDRDGNMTVGPIATGRLVALGPLGFHAATSGSTLLVVTEGSGAEFGPAPADAHLLGLDGGLLGAAVPVSRSCVWECGPFEPCGECTKGSGFWRGMAAFWEGDAYALLWNTWPDAMVADRRFLVVP